MDVKDLAKRRSDGRWRAVAARMLCQYGGLTQRAAHPCWGCKPARRSVASCANCPNATGAFFIQALSERIDNITIEGNLLDGGEGWTTWQDNYRYDPNRADGKGAVVNQ